MTTPPVPESIRELATQVAARGGRAWLVGGGVRDHLMGLPVKDWDVEVFGVPADDLVRLLRRLGRVDAVGRSFGVYKLRPRSARPEDPEIDVSIPRRDSKVGPGHRGIAVEGDPGMSTREAARRRDLTVNAILLDVLTGEIEDPFDGRGDIARGVLRAVDRETFLEDPLRAVRVVQFAARLGFAPDPTLVELCRTADLHELPAERVQGEWTKLLLRSERPSTGLQVARDTMVLQRLFPEAARADGPAVDRALDRAARLRDALEPEGRRLALLLAAWLHPDPDVVEPTLDRLWLHRHKGYPLRDRVLQAVRHHRDPHGTDAELRWLSTRCELALTLRLAWAAGEDEAPLEALRRATEIGVAEQAPEPLLKGRHLQRLGVQPGPTMGELLRRVYERQLDGVITTAEQALEEATRLLGEDPA